MNTITPGIYKHFKGGIYEVLGCGYHSETLERVVIYRSQYSIEQFPQGTMWARPLELFIAPQKDGTPRFTLQK